jgi:gas vesicle protein
VDDTKSLSYFFLGLGIGIAAGVIFAPQSGSETRGKIRSKAMESGDYVRRRSEQLRESATGIVDRGREAVNRQRDTLNSALDAGRQAYRDALTQARPAGESAGEVTGDVAQGI